MGSTFSCIVISYPQNDVIGQEWFVQAGLNRGGLSEVTEEDANKTNQLRKR